jgi:hypothetical protein
MQEEYEELLKYAVVVPSYPTMSSLGLGRSLAGGDYHVSSVQPSVSLAAEVAGQQTSRADQLPVTSAIATSAPSQSKKSDFECKPNTASVKLQATAIADTVDVNLPASGGSCVYFVVTYSACVT